VTQKRVSKKPAPKRKAGSTSKRPASKRGATAKRRTRSEPSARPYRAPLTAAELGITCYECGAPAEWYDYARGRKHHRRGFICGLHERDSRSEKLLVRASPRPQ